MFIWDATLRLAEVDHVRTEALFEAAAAQRSRACELKRELDQLNVFSEYEDWFLDLFEE